MNIKSLLLGSAAALAVVSGAQAADAIVAAEPEPMEYVRVCDAFGTGYFYIPGTETCLKVSGYVRFETGFDSYDRGAGKDDFDWNARTRAKVNFEAKNDSELGTIGSYIAFRTWAENDGTDKDTNKLEIDEAYITAGGFKVGYMYNYWDNDLSGETDDLGSNRLNAIGYEYAADAFSVGVFVEELTRTYSSGYDFYKGNDNIGLDAQVAATFGVVSGELLGAYDFAAENGAVRGKLFADIGPGTLGVAAIWSSGANAYYDVSEWTVAAQYEAKLTDKLSLTPGFQYWWNYGLVSTDEFDDNNDAWTAGLTLDYKVAEGLTTKIAVNYLEEDHGKYEDGLWNGFVRLQRSF
ncbi:MULTISPECIES: porin [Alphaproteobacteria]|uniref:Porin n=2 Tax=Alphaproteobacteria TaxID=28211 RepID=A0A512HGA2_9HYPH|nr:MULTISPECIES: porin [Alphaproteobacteria]GEO84466.1 outer membrane protein [Ciceribacter naphthalenivorans]GLR22429.1 outer membrane protein [Ciceribacter naphthalenivorans]GLT05285.1 outer membrane protein [Sphingomonas psychrolutea]